MSEHPTTASAETPAEWKPCSHRDFWAASCAECMYYLGKAQKLAAVSPQAAPTDEWPRTRLERRAAQMISGGYEDPSEPILDT